MTTLPPTPLTNALLLDTHNVVWLDSGNERLLPPTRALIDACWQRGGSLYVSAVSAWEIAQLVERGRITLHLPVRRWIEGLTDRFGTETISLTYEAATRAYALPDWFHRDPGDRLLIATAIELHVPLVTYDERIAAFARNYRNAIGFGNAKLNRVHFGNRSPAVRT
ncbi:MAG TPA: type II toxin-antitoxin system VapC family toxin [Rhodopila sp.]|nr:type II toxin-antitoxin system VapC family toxin [Rhodopila sp.]